MVAEARRVRRVKGKTGRLSNREISARLKDAGYRNERGEQFNPPVSSSNDRGTACAAAATAVTRPFLPPASDPGGQADQK